MARRRVGVKGVLLLLAGACSVALFFRSGASAQQPTAAPTAPAAPAPAELQGRIELLPPPGQSVSPAGSVVYIPGVVTGRAAAAPAITSRNKRFDPHVLAVASGQSVAFPNVDSIYHNAFSLSPGNPFDLGLYRKGASRSISFKKPGLVRVYCNIHPEMAAYVMVVDGDAHTLVSADGAFRIAGIPAGRHSVFVWNELAGEQSAVLDFRSGQATRWEVKLDATQYRPMLHKNKFGKDYPPASKDANRY